MSDTPSEHRRSQERRRRPRGGRRPADGRGFSPLVLLIGDDESVVAQAEAILATLHFAVATSPSVEDALHVVSGIRPNVVVAGAVDASRIRTEAPEHLPVVVMTEEMRTNHETLVEGIRATLRANTTR